MRKILTPNIVSVAALVVLAILGWKSLSLWNQRQKVNREIAVLTRQKQDLQGKNQQIQESLRYLNTQSYKDQLPRQQDLQHPGEVVINLPENVDVQQAGEANAKSGSNLLLWWKYFFKR